jgi:MtN3 and saliva related transmembrane protein
MQMPAVFEIMGTTGSFAICASAIPQVVKTYRTKRSRDLSIAYLSVLMLGISLLQSYSLYVGDFVFILANTLSMFSTGLLIVLWFRYEARGERRGARGKDESKRITSHRPARITAGKHTQTHAGKEIPRTEQTSFLHNLQELS